MNAPMLPIRFLFFVFIFFGNFIGCITEATSKIDSDNSVKISEELYNAPVFYKSHEPKKQEASFSDAVQVGNVFYLSGQIGMDHATRTLVDGGVVFETKQAIENIRDVLSQHNLTINDVVKVTVILDDIADFSAFDEVYSGYFLQKPARTTFAAESLAKGAKIEIEVVAVASKRANIIHG